MIFGFGGNKGKVQAEEEEEADLILFQGAITEDEVDLSSHARLAEAGLLRAKEIVTDAIERRADTVRLDPRGDRFSIHLMVDGIAYSGGALSKQEAAAVHQMLKLMTALDVKDRKSVQVGLLKGEFNDRKYIVKLEFVPMKSGPQRLNFYIHDLKNQVNSPDELNLNPLFKEKVREYGGERSGILLAAGPPGSGTSTTAFAIARGIDAFIYSMYTVIDAGYRDLKNITEFELDVEDELDNKINRLIRMEADVIFCPPIDSPEIAKTLFERQSEIALISEVVTKDVATAVESLIHYTGSPEMVTEGVRLIFSQKLIRPLCDKCKVPYRPNPKIIKKMGLPEGTETLYRPPKEEEMVRVCRKCGGLGYYGRVAMLEMLEMTDEIKQVIISGASAADIKAHARNQKMLTFRDDGLRMIAEGTTSLEELQRVFKAG